METGEDPYLNLTKGEFCGTTLCQIPAFDGLSITLGERETRDVALVASIVEEIKMQTYARELFSDPKLPSPTRPTMNEKTGRIYGHLAEWSQTYRGGRGERVPRNVNDYANFHTSQVMLDDGKQLAVGHLTVKGGHAPTTSNITAATARAHYDNACTAFGMVRVGEDRFGIWFSGVPAPGVDAETFQQGMTLPLSGDWRDCGQGLDMIAAHAVITPGFPIAGGATDEYGREVALVASFAPSLKSKRTKGGFNITRDELKTLLVEVTDELTQRSTKRDTEAVSVARRKTALARAQAAVGKPPNKAQQALAKTRAALAKVT
jgi:hypothetical protein